MDRIAVVLAAGLGTRMKSKTPKVLHKLAGLPMLQHVLNALDAAQFREIITVLGHRGDEVTAALGLDCAVVYQEQQLGTGHALLMALPALQKYAEGDCLVVCGDTPCLRGETLRSLAQKHSQSGASVTVLTALLDNPSGYGRIIKGPQGIEKIAEEKDADGEEKAIKEVNTGTYCFSMAALKKWLGTLTPANAQGEYYLTDIIRCSVAAGEKVETLLLRDPQEALGVNDRLQLAAAEKIWRRRINEQWMTDGVTIVDPDNTYIDAGVSIGQDTVLLPGVILEGDTKIGEDCVIGPDSRIINSHLGDKVTLTYASVVGAEVGSGCKIGPFCYLRPGAVLGENVKAGDFVEIKKSIIGEGSKVPHLTYIGDSIIGKDVNIGAGTITCNYDGVAKHLTAIGDGAFVGSNSNLVAPLTIGAGAYIGAGSTVTKDIPEAALAVARAKQKNIEDWPRRALNKQGYNDAHQAGDNAAAKLGKDRGDEDVEL